MITQLGTGLHFLRGRKGGTPLRKIKIFLDILLVNRQIGILKKFDLIWRTLSGSFEASKLLGVLKTPPPALIGLREHLQYLKCTKSKVYIFFLLQNPLQLMQVYNPFHTQFQDEFQVHEDLKGRYHIRLHHNRNHVVLCGVQVRLFFQTISHSFHNSEDLTNHSFRYHLAVEFCFSCRQQDVVGKGSKGGRTID